MWNLCFVNYRRNADGEETYLLKIQIKLLKYFKVPWHKETAQLSLWQLKCGPSLFGFWQREPIDFKAAAEPKTVWHDHLISFPHLSALSHMLWRHTIYFSLVLIKAQPLGALWILQVDSTLYRTPTLHLRNFTIFCSWEKWYVALVGNNSHIIFIKSKMNVAVVHSDWLHECVLFSIQECMFWLAHKALEEQPTCFSNEFKSIFAFFKFSLVFSRSNTNEPWNAFQTVWQDKLDKITSRKIERNTLNSRWECSRVLGIKRQCSKYISIIHTVWGT